MIELQDITKRFDAKTAVSGLTLTIRPGELFAFLGPNGAGKTTTIKMIIGLLRADEGAVRVCGHDILTNAVEAKARVSYIPDQPYLYDKLTGREFLNFVAGMYRMDAGTHRENIDRLAGVLELNDFLDDLCEQYSHGMKQRVVIAAALLHDPEVIVVDEPMVGLDPKSSRVVKDILHRRSRDGATVFMSTHTLGVAEELADHIGIIHHGDLIAMGTLEDVRRSSGGARGLEESFLHLTAEEE